MALDKTVTIRFPIDEWNSVEKYSISCDITMSEIVRRAVRKYIRDNAYVTERQEELKRINNV